MKMRFGMLVFALAALAAPQAGAVTLENPVLIVKVDEVPLADDMLARKLRHSLYWGGVRMVSAETFASLSENVAEALAHAGAHTLQTVCASGDSPCVTVILK